MSKSNSSCSVNETGSLDPDPQQELSTLEHVTTAGIVCPRYFVTDNRIAQISGLWHTSTRELLLQLAR
ncbi:MAG TPA: hypothetical protein VFB92_17685 [Vicinamibacterales bacterium]|nr:hypothetical protein [Vicinamibacterales bacterium]